MSGKVTGRLRSYAVEAAPRPTRKATRFKCRNCGQKVLVDATLHRVAILCPTCEHLVVAPRPGRLWLEMVGATLIFLIGLALGHSPHGQGNFPAPTTATILDDHGKSKTPAAENPPRKPGWFSSQADGNP